MPTPAPTQVIAPTPIPICLGVGHGEIREVFGLAYTGGFTMHSAPLQTGEPRLLGPYSDERAILEVVGPVHDVRKVTLAMESAPQFAKNNSIYMAAIFVLVVPEWEGAGDWVSNSYDVIVRDGEVSTVRNGKRITIKTNPVLGIIILRKLHKPARSSRPSEMRGIITQPSKTDHE